MNTAAQRATDVARTGPEQPLSARQQSLLFPALLERLDRKRKLTILEVGCARSESVDFFSAFRCRVYFADLFADPLVLSGQHEMDETALVKAFQKVLNFAAGTRLDLCLFWDLFNYLEDHSVRAFNQALAPSLHAGTLGHGFALRTRDTAIRQQRYGILAPHMFSVHAAARKLACYPHTQAILVNLLSRFDIERGMLLPDGRLEMSLAASV